MARIDSARSQEIRHLPTNRLILPCSNRRLVIRSEGSPAVGGNLEYRFHRTPKLDCFPTARHWLLLSQPWSDHTMDCHRTSQRTVFYFFAFSVSSVVSLLFGVALKTWNSCNAGDSTTVTPLWVFHGPSASISPLSPSPVESLYH